MAGPSEFEIGSLLTLDDAVSNCKRFNNVQFIARARVYAHYARRRGHVCAYIY
jgi:hypothetical protein